MAPLCCTESLTRMFGNCCFDKGEKAKRSISYHGMDTVNHIFVSRVEFSLYLLPWRHLPKHIAMEPLRRSLSVYMTGLMEELTGIMTTADQAYAELEMWWPVWAIRPITQMGNQHRKSVTTISDSWRATAMSRLYRRFACSSFRDTVLEFAQLAR